MYVVQFISRCFVFYSEDFIFGEDVGLIKHVRAVLVSSVLHWRAPLSF